MYLSVIIKITIFNCSILLRNDEYENLLYIYYIIKQLLFCK